METIGVNLAYASATGKIAGMEGPLTDNGSGFIENAHYLMVFSGVDRWGNDWDAERVSMADKQINWYCDAEHYNKYLCDAGLFGLSASEDPMNCSYVAYGTGGKGEPNDGDGVIVLHYPAMIADIKPDEAKHVWEVLRDGSPDFLKETIAISPLNNMENMYVNKDTGMPAINHFKGSWNLALQAEGWAMTDPAIKKMLERGNQKIA